MFCRGATPRLPTALLARAVFWTGQGIFLRWGALALGVALVGAVECDGQLVSSAVKELKKDPSIGRAEALRRTEMAMLDPTNPSEYAHPAYWAPFVLAGEGGAGR